MLRQQFAHWEQLRDVALQPALERTGDLDIVALLDGLARVSSLALQHGVPHQQVMDAVRPDPRGVAGATTGRSTSPSRSAA